MADPWPSDVSLLATDPIGIESVHSPDPAVGKSRWWERFDELSRFVAHHGVLPRYNAPKGSLERSLHTWMSNQRELDSRGLLPDGQRQSLDAYGVFRDTHRAVWWRNHAAVKAFLDASGRLPCETADAAHERRLGSWVRHAKARALDGVLDPDQVGALHELGVRMVRRRYRSPQEIDERYGELESYLARNCLPRSSVPDEVAAHRWLCRQIQGYRQGLLSEERRVVIERALEMRARRAPTFLRTWVDVRTFVARHGRLPASSSATLEEQVLGEWVDHQRQALMEGRRSARSVIQLKQIGIHHSQ